MKNQFTQVTVTSHKTVEVSNGIETIGYNHDCNWLSELDEEYYILKFNNDIKKMKTKFKTTKTNEFKTKRRSLSSIFKRLFSMLYIKVFKNTNV